MGLDRTRWPELLVGLERVRVLEVARGLDGRLHVAVETTDDVAVCPGCGVRAESKDRDRVELVDLRAFGSAVRMVWVKRRWCCPELLCGRGVVDRGTSRHRGASLWVDPPGWVVGD